LYEIHNLEKKAWGLLGLRKSCSELKGLVAAWLLRLILGFVLYNRQTTTIYRIPDKMVVVIWLL
jgi:hypothetical protein